MLTTQTKVVSYDIMPEHQTLWHPGVSLEAEYPAATPAEIATKITEITHSSEVTQLNILGAIRTPTPEQQIRGVASIDLCEVVRNTANSVSRIFGQNYAGNDYLQAIGGEARFADSEDRHSDYARRTIDALVHVLINHQLVHPVDNIETIHHILQNWHQNGIYIIANTSTLAGGELGTLEFLNTHLPDVFDGIVFPRNFDGNGHITKADALKEVIDTLGIYEHMPEFALHIDDTLHHHQAMAEAPPHQTDMRLYAPLYVEDIALRSVAGLQTAHSPLAAFRQADLDIRQQARRAA